MDTLVQLNALHPQLWIYLSIDIGIALCLLFGVRWLAGRYSNISVSKELSVRDNFAFGISVAGRMLSLCIVMGSVVGRHVGEGYQTAALGMLLFGLVSIILVKLGRVAHDKLVLNRLDKEQMIDDKNISVAIVDAASAIAAAIMLRSMLLWVEGTDMNALVAITSGFSVVLLVLLIMTRIYEARFASHNQNDSFQKTLCKGQVALAIAHSGNLIGTALMVSAAASLLRYNPETYVSNITGWLFSSIALAGVLLLLVAIAKRLVLAGCDWKQEVDQQVNVGVASIQWVLSVGIAMIVLGVLTHAS
ncbi:DUF350 domain-containing protein [Alteromonas oceanisediminis]|uniref:DUF350 domain-containing protein n=1 Tax=Alteromonas oceanisediminis TaxID=2836180 RepID=UPI001BDAC3C1|nr:DUF350 domain-containing protein [Alteromonas oceanisediminis]MBT0585653.1 DUF350 domain-containing protein [Alteromonas oceanisediminis]